MGFQRADFLRAVLEEGIGADIVVETDSSGVRTGLRSYFAGLTQNQGPICTITPSGLKRHLVSIEFGKFSLPCIAQMQGAKDESLEVARALVRQVASEHAVEIEPAQNLNSWSVVSPEFKIRATVREIESPTSADSIAKTAKTVMVPLMAAMAELIGYEEAEQETHGELEGTIVLTEVLRRERSPRNRLLCLSIHGRKCIACDLQPDERYGEAGNIIEVHHLEPLALTNSPRRYNPARDLVPLCPSCHRAVHTRKPVPYTIEELKEFLARGVT